jgi:hypothetical protein
MEATSSSETSVYNKPKRRHITEYGIPHSHSHGNLKSYITFGWFISHQRLSASQFRKRTVRTLKFMGKSEGRAFKQFFLYYLVMHPVARVIKVCQ